MTFKIGAVEFKSYIAEGGIDWARNDLDDESSGRTLDGVMHRKRITSKIKLSVKCITLTTAQMQVLNTALSPEYVTVTYLDPKLGETTKTFYGSSVSSTTQREKNGVVYWDNTKFELTER